jgi:hypothetical protein
LRQVVESTSEYKPGPFTGAPETVADALQHWFETKATDGYNVRFRTVGELENFVGTVVPILQKRGAFRTEYESDTLRGNLGLPFPVNRYTAERELARASA